MPAVLWCKSRLRHFWYFLSFCCLYKSKKGSCRFTDVSFTLMFPSIHHTDIVQRQLGIVGKMSRYRIKVPHNSLIVLSSLLSPWLLHTNSGVTDMLSTETEKRLT